MKVQICAVGRLRSGPEAELVADYLARFDRTGRPHGLGPATIAEVEDRKGGGMAAEAELLQRSLPAGALTVVMDERGQMPSSPDFAAMLVRWRDQGRDVAFVIGGADGLSPALRDRADAAISLGTMVWPHMLVRVMLAEQLYRAATIIAGTPYHRA
ncbi:23S rRNA (pseudouridine(1915)-N(3))-methyltransferase RlmH [Haematobacter massiliensis]|uniref:Ribosomal RNA large subunit methyltransferase H n=1 Tax=Haematobacter massiliensis TaxID=195105 RepID=A0A086Y899_9RHOB|nr:23S rRNA (pseudouridine(1915)-N(3))-methyltransferase RlmH [Haematobacter massiliensis]KFI30499.1 50S rRNA methyltransferase [Haematobacter massiliensis]OWJ70972.1 23S rRNA (pseudouridine(1915)-N(3))-methyltransferase RlmH [Haematobacter massiliensis]OWJ87512.1 23S rRNA (pseudouridine(1915)-N(3))-methyltransferase RlmH [Haematobacter massiliensis]